MNRTRKCEYFLNLGYYFLIKYCDRYKFTNLYTNVIPGNILYRIKMFKNVLHIFMHALLVSIVLIKVLQKILREFQCHTKGA